jgi:hypothetical protein
MDKPFYIVKVIDKKWADKLIEGQVFMRPLSDFSDIESRPDNCNNNFRGDILEAVTHSFAKGDEHQFFKDALGDENSKLSESGFISESLRQEKIVYCMLCLEFSEQNSCFIPPNTDFQNFGDTAVIIFDPKEFMMRICKSLFNEHNETYWFGASRVRYDLDFAQTKEYNEFSKSPLYSWQNEFRIAVDLSDGKLDKITWERMTDFARIMYINQGGKVDMGMDRKPITLDIGNINDISVQVNIEDFLALNLPFDKLLLPPMTIPTILPPRKSNISVIRPIMKPNE